MIPEVSKPYIKNQIDIVREKIGRTVTVYTPRHDPCSICAASGYYDPISDNSFYVKCPQCHGNYWLATVDATEILARVHWVQDEAITATPGGKYYLGDAQITIDNKYRELAEKAQNDSGKIVVDNHDMQILRISPMGAPEINRYRIILRGMGDRPKE